MIKHRKHSVVADGTNPSKVQPSDWNDDHIMSAVVTYEDYDASAGDFVYFKSDDSSLPVTDPYFADVTLLMPLEANFADVVGGNTVTVVGSPTITNTDNPAPFGTNCGQFGANAYARFEFDADSFLFTSDYTFEGWFRPTTADLSGIRELYVNRGSGTPVNMGFQSGQPFVWYGNTYVSSGFAFAADTNYYIAYQRRGSLAEVFVNGTRVASASSVAGVLGSSNVQVSICGDVSGNGQHFAGTAKDIRLTNGTARYTGTTHAVPTGPHPTSNAGLNLNLPADPAPGDLITFIPGPGPVWVSVVAAAGDNVNGASSVAVPPGLTPRMVVFDGAKWVV